MTPEENERLAEIERRLARLEAAWEVGQAPRPVSLRQESPPAVPAPRFGQPPPRPEEPYIQPERPRVIETAFGLTWISRIGVITVVLALAFFFEYAFENHWITEPTRVLLGIGCGAAALFFGERFWRSGQHAYGQALSAAGIAFLYLSFWAAFGLYHLIAQSVAFLLMALATALAGALALRYDSAAFAMLGLAGGYATPLLLASAQAPWFVLGYALVLDLGAAFGARARGWQWPEALALAGTVVLYVKQLPVSAGSRPVYALFILAYYGLFVATGWLPVAVIAQLLAGMALVGIWAPVAGALAGALLLAGAGLVVAEWRGWPIAATASFAGFWLAYAVWDTQTGGARPLAATLGILTLAFVMFLARPVWRAAERRQTLGLQDLLLVPLNAALYFGTCYGLLLPGFGALEGLFAVAVAAAQMGAARLLWRHDARGALLAVGAGWVLLVLAAPIQFAGYRVTIAWALEGAAMTWIGVRLQDRRARAGALTVFLLVLMRLGFVDSIMYESVSGYSILANARFLAFAASAAALWAAAWWIRRGTLALIAYVGGHAILLWGLCLEAAGWAQRTAAPQNVPSVVSTSISVLVAGYAVLLVAGGALQRHAASRVLGMALIGLVVVKLYLYDVWLLGQFYRMAAFAILGVLLLVMSYLYSRFRGSIESWWRP